MAQTLLARNQEAISHHLAYTEFLELLVSDELARRRDRLFTRRLKAARVPQIKTLGVNPLLMISALAERSCFRVATGGHEDVFSDCPM